MMNRVVCVDADGVLVDFLRVWSQAMQDVLGKSMPLLRNQYPLADRYGLQPYELDAVWHHFNTQNLWESLPEMPGAVEAIRLLREHDYQVNVVTMIEPEILPARLNNFEAIGMPMVPVHVCSGTKEHILRKLGAVAHFDDNPAHINEALEAGVEARMHVVNHVGDLSPSAATGRHHCLLNAVNDFILTFQDKRGMTVSFE
ncbi:5' nucleotidase, NT5C type [Methylobacillus sp. Pita2]|uniref:5' nucleotidase, NT5C type n=1 Tax=Methylobacillus sp. Pita2 TaxID=3383245 RepID=UPI0038B4D151